MLWNENSKDYDMVIPRHQRYRQLRVQVNLNYTGKYCFASIWTSFPICKITILVFDVIMNRNEQLCGRNIEVSHINVVLYLSKENI